MRKRNRNNGHCKIKRRSYVIDLRHLAHSKYAEQANGLPKGILYMEDSIGNSGFFIEALVPALMAPQYVPRSKAVAHPPETSLIEGMCRVFWKRNVDEKLKRAIVEKCLILQSLS